MIRPGCVARGHEWGVWMQSADMPMKVRVCERCDKRQVIWNGNLRHPWKVEPVPDMPPSKPTRRARFWDAIGAALAKVTRPIRDRVRPHRRYAGYVARHKWFVFRAGLRTRAPIWRLLIHDYTKLMPVEWGPYVRRFYGGRPGVPVTDDDSDDFRRAWLHHQHRNPHHWQHWVLRQDDGNVVTLPMPRKFVREMVADWMGAGRAITGQWGAREWYENGAGEAMDLHPDTRRMAEELLKGQDQ